VSTGGARQHGGGRAVVDRWAAGREVLRAADPRMAALVDADPGLDPEAWMDRLPSDLWGALVLQVIGQQLSLAAAAAILARLEALHGGRLPTPAELLGMNAKALRQIGLSTAKGVYLHDLAARLQDGRLDLERLLTLDDDDARNELTQVKASAGSPPTVCSCWRCAGRTFGPPPIWHCAGRSSGSGGWMPRRPSRRWTISASVSGRGGRWRPHTSTGPGGRDDWLRRVRKTLLSLPSPAIDYLGMSEASFVRRLPLRELHLVHVSVGAEADVRAVRGQARVVVADTDQICRAHPLTRHAAVWL
jgi:HhH-GPD superfamily base excision DNA repair protein